VLNESPEQDLSLRNEWRQAPYQSALQPAAEPAPEGYQSALSPVELPAEIEGAPAPPPPNPSLSARTRLGLGILVVACSVGVSGDALLRAVPWGINLLLWLLLTTGTVVIWRRREGLPFSREAIGLTVTACLFSAGIAWRASAVLHGLDLLALAVLLILLGLRSRVGKLIVADVSEYFGAALQTFGNLLAGAPLLLLNEIGWRELPRGNWSQRTAAVARGVLLALPLLLVFGLLLVLADAAFEALVLRLFRLDFASLFWHACTIGGIAWLVSGYLRSLEPHSRLSTWPSAAKRAPSLGIVELGTALGLLNLLFLAFVLVQFQYLFFGAAHFKPGAGTAYAIYARRGFFELVTVAALVLPLLLGAHWLLRKDEPRAERIFRLLAGLQIGLLFVMMGSAMYRMRLYQLCCGLTELRVYTMAFMIWLALVFIWFALTVLRGQRERFAFGAVVARLVLIAALHVLNPDDLIARVNLQRARAGLPFDALYTTSLSADSFPALAEGLPYLKADEQRLVRQHLLDRQAEFTYAGWRSWNWSRMRAWQSCEAIR
jgi:hypothetical protein